MRPDMQSAGGIADTQKERDGFTATKLRWIQQICTDHDLPPLARVVGCVLATKYLNRETRDAWPALDTLAADVGRSSTQVREALAALARCGHLNIATTVGGKAQTNRYRPAIKPLGNPEGNKRSNPSDSRADTLRKIDPKPLGNPEGNPFEEPIDEPRAGFKPAPGRFSTIEGSRDALERASPTSFREDDTYLIPGVGDGWIEKILSSDPWTFIVCVRDHQFNASLFRVEQRAGSGPSAIIPVDFDYKPLPLPASPSGDEIRTMAHGSA